MSDDLKMVLLGLLNPDEKRRLSADSALHLPVVQKALQRKKIKDKCRMMVCYFKIF